MTRALRVLLSAADNAAPPPEAVALESDFVVILAALLCALICVVGLVAVARCAWLRRGSAADGSAPHRALANKGLKKKVLQSLPRFEYVEGNPNVAGGWVATPDCAICLSDFVAGDEIRVLPQCGHGFHVACIDTWLGSHSSCPSCRQVLAVSRCQKCGRLPVAGGGGGGAAAGVAVRETEMKSREDDNAVANNNNSGGESGSCNVGQHNSGFLP